MNIAKTPEYQAGLQWIKDRAFPDAPDWSEIYMEASRRYREKKHSYINHPKWFAFVVGAAQSRLEARDPEAGVAIERFMEGWKETLELYEKGADPNPPSPPGTGRTVHYMALITPGPFIMIRTPYPTPLWRKVVTALTPILHAHDMKRKDLRAVDGLLPSPDVPFSKEDMDFALRLDAAYEGDPEKLPQWWLYDWKGNRFVLVREPSKE